ncbi:hypothetical protein ACEQUB_02046 [Ralstonia syzygii]
MSYQVLARKWRPRDFTTLVGQEHVVKALTHALEQQRLHHAYLFTGTRGVGKTTLSRILAKSLNCVGTDGQGGITAQPCGVCRACTEIDTGRFVDYIEMDAASNRGVDEMAQLLDRAVYAPTAGRFKVYMIDEVHMLTNHAFNAMLKTLEEPPEHVKFILATTDPQKIPVTVLSRCLQFNLKQMPPGHIVSHLDRILGEEGIAHEPNALRLLAAAAQGSMRDALSLTDQAIAYSAGEVSEVAVRGMLGAIDQSYLVRLLDALADAHGAALIEIADEMAGRSLRLLGGAAGPRLAAAEDRAGAGRARRGAGRLARGRRHPPPGGALRCAVGATVLPVRQPRPQRAGTGARRICRLHDDAAAHAGVPARPVERRCDAAVGGRPACRAAGGCAGRIVTTGRGGGRWAGCPGCARCTRGAGGRGTACDVSSRSAGRRRTGRGACRCDAGPSQRAVPPLAGAGSVGRGTPGVESGRARWCCCGTGGFHARPVPAPAARPAMAGPRPNPATAPASPPRREPAAASAAADDFGPPPWEEMPGEFASPSLDQIDAAFAGWEAASTTRPGAQASVARPAQTESPTAAPVPTKAAATEPVAAATP